jgi:hypothetical protein
VLHPHDGRTDTAGALNQGRDVRDHRVTRVRVIHDTVLDIDHDQGAVGTVRKRGHWE